MKSLPTVLLASILTLSSILFLTPIARSTHGGGGELFYRHTNDSSYEFTLIFLRNCQGFTATAPTSFTLNARAPSIGANNTFVVSRLPTTGLNVPPLSPPGLFNCTQAQSSLCYEEYYYRGTWNSPRRASDWVFSYSVCCLPLTNGPTNVQNGNLYVECGLNNLDFPDNKSKNWSPIFHNRRPNHPGYLTDTIVNYMFKTLCAGNYYSLDLSAKEYQGDSVIYNFFRPKDNATSNLVYINGWSFTQPFPTLSGPPSLNKYTGILPVTAGSPTGTGVYIIGVEAVEYRKDTVVAPFGTSIISKIIGFNRRNITLWIDDSSTCRRDSAHIKDIHLNEIPADSILHVTFNNGNTNAPNSLLRCQSLSKDGSEFRVVDSSNYVAPYDTTVRVIPVLGATWSCYGGFTNSVNLKMGARLTCGDYYIYLKVGTDLDVIESECGYWEPEYSAAKIHTDSISSPNIGPDLVGCTNRLFTRKIDAGPGYHHYYWNTYDTTRVISASYLGTFWVKVSNQFECEATDTVEITGVICDSQGPAGNSYPFNLGINSSDAQNAGVRIYPNPTAGILNIQVEKSQVGSEMTIRNLGGKAIYYSVLSKVNSQVDLSSIVTGIYLVEILTQSGEIIHNKIVVK